VDCTLSRSAASPSVAKIVIVDMFECTSRAPSAVLVYRPWPSEYGRSVTTDLESQT